VVALRLDARLSGYAVKMGIRYSRYADDLTFSGDFNPGSVVVFVCSVCAEEGVRLNAAKTRLMQRHERQKVTGIVVNERLSAPRDARRELRQATHYIKRFGLNAHVERAGIKRANYVQHLMGVANFILFLDPEDRDALDAMRVLKPLLPKAQAVSVQEQVQ
jgi:RNA-directed DNA polymerase